MQVHNLSNQNTLLNTFLSELRCVEIQKDAMRFRRNIERIGEILAYEMSKTLDYNSTNITTPLDTKSVFLPQKDIVICSILRAGLPLHNGILNYFDSAENAFISAYRHHKANSDDFEILVEYAACPSLEGKTLILADPMLATGQSLALTYNALLQYGIPKKVHILSVIGAQQGVNYIDNKFPANTELWISDIDQTLNDKGYIVPGLGDAGDLAFGVKLQQ
jgi:uracil phosphoribosyltransferase